MLPFLARMAGSFALDIATEAIKPPTTAGYRVGTEWYGKRVQARLKTGEVRALFRAGGLVRTIASRSIKKISPLTSGKKRRGRKGKQKPKHAPAGSPPFTRTGILKKTIQFGVNRMAGSVAIGAIPFGSNSAGQLEHGGKAKLTGYGKKQYAMTFKGNPFMASALETAQPKLPAQFRNIL